MTLGPPAAARLFQPLGGVAVMGTSTWAVLQGRKKLKVTWDDGPNAGFESGAFAKQLAADGEPARDGGAAISATWTPSSPGAAR